MIVSGRLRKFTAAAGVAVALAGGMTLAAPTAAIAGAPSIAADPCGLSGEMRSHPAPGWNWYNYRIRNCHNYDVRRRVDVSNTVSDDGRCHFVPAGGTVLSRMEINTQYDGIYGLKAC
jgi:hypothetical protein